MGWFAQRTINAFTALLVGIGLYLLRRLLAPTVFESGGLPFEIAGPSALNACYRNATINNCGDLGIVVITTIAVAVATGWGSVGRGIFAAILSISPIGLYLVGAPIWVSAILLAMMPLAIDLGARWLFPQT
ncbi:MAG: hypothetical protein AB4911_03640 [Oscillochloridaceae bacterium umkhey_bin13]